ncbi:MAG TPA: alkaline phosphatase family protein, partial [Rhizomicrobium sp.]|nr:alkaline phosphatase family protein [Rhizomicrobium sp.]
MRFRLFAAPALLTFLIALPVSAAPRNVLIFVADGLRYVSVTPQSAPALWRLKKRGVDFTNSHSLYPTITTVNASAIATGHYIGDTGDFGNQLLTNFASPEAGNSRTPFLESDNILGEMNDHYSGNYLNEETLLAAARKAGFATAAIGKTGPTAIQDVTSRDGSGTIVIDDSIGTADSIPVSTEIAAAIHDAGIAPAAPKTAVPNIDQQQYLLGIATRVVLPKLARAQRGFIMVFWSRDPDASQHGTKDSLGKLSPGINGPSGMAGIRDASDSLQALLDALKTLGLDKTTDVFVTADHGFSTIWRKSKTSKAPTFAATPDATPSDDGPELPAGFLAMDLADGLGLPLYDTSTLKQIDYQHGERPRAGNGYIGYDPNNPDIVVVSNGGSDHIYIPGANAKDRAAQIVGVLAKEDYVSGIFANDTLGEIQGALPMSAINLMGSAVTQQPSLIVNFRSFTIPGCAPALMCAAEVADTSLQSGQGMHGSFSRADTRNFMAALGPDFKSRFADGAPVSNADITQTLAHILKLRLTPKGTL